MKDTEELVDFYIHRPLAHRIARALASTGVTPNGVTIAGGVLGVLAGVSLWYGATDVPLRLVAAALLFASVVLDCTDGQLARLTNHTSRAGVALDGFTDAIVGFAMIAAASHVLAVAYPGPWMWALGLVAMASSEAQCFLFDVAKERYLAAQQAGAGKLLIPERQPAGPDESAFLVRRFDDYMSIVRTLAAAPGSLTRGQMRAWATIGLGTHFALLYVSAALSYVWPPALLVCLMIFSTVMNGVLLTLLWLSPVNFTG